MRPHWSNCITHFDDDARAFVHQYFSHPDRQCFLVAAAGFDPRSLAVAQMLGAALGNRLAGLFVREERARPDKTLKAAADDNETKLRAMVATCDVVSVAVFGDDDAPVGGARIAKIIGDLAIPDFITDVVLDMTALSIGIGFPAARLLLAACEQRPGRSFHILVASNPELDDRIASEPGDRPMAVRGFAGTSHLSGTKPVARMWIPQLARGRGGVLDVVGASVGDAYKICPVLPFPARDPRRADALLAEYQSRLVDEWAVDPRDLVYVSERNPLDCYRTLSTLKDRYQRTVEEVFEPQIILSPIGGKVMAVGALMAAIEYDLTVQYLETVRYDFDHMAPPPSQALPDMIVYLLLSGPAYGDYRESAAPTPAP